MGNCVSASGIMPTEIRVVHSSEKRVLGVELPSLQCSMKVGELMLEFPLGHFITQLSLKPNSSPNLMGMRATPLGADADAYTGTAYVLFPMSRLHTRITPEEILSFLQLIQLQDQPQFATKLPAQNSSRAHVHGLFTAGARVVPIAEEASTNATCGTVDGAKNQAYSFPISAQQVSYEDSSSMLSSCRRAAHLGMMKGKPWAPVLQTIIESSETTF